MKICLLVNNLAAGKGATMTEATKVCSTLRVVSLHMSPFLDPKVQAVPQLSIVPSPPTWWVFIVFHDPQVWGDKLTKTTALPPSEVEHYMPKWIDLKRNVRIVATVQVGWEWLEILFSLETHRRLFFFFRSQRYLFACFQSPQKLVGSPATAVIFFFFFIAQGTVVCDDRPQTKTNDASPRIRQLWRQRVIHSCLP